MLNYSWTTMSTRLRFNQRLRSMICYLHGHDLRKLNFTNRVIPVWNSLPNHVVSADTINTF